MTHLKLKNVVDTSPITPLEWDTIQEALFERGLDGIIYGDDLEDYSTAEELADAIYDKIYDALYEVIDDETIYYSDCWQYLEEHNITHFEDAIHDGCTDICSIAGYYMREDTNIYEVFEVLKDWINENVEEVTDDLDDLDDIL